MKINIFFDFHKRLWGSGNQFLRALRDEWIEKDRYELDPQKADIILFNSHHNILQLSTFKYFHPHEIFVQRVEGPTYATEESDEKVDQFVFQTNRYLSDATIFQSPWSRQKCLESGLTIPDYEITIINAPDPTIFFPLERKIRHNKIQIVAASLSPNWNKGFDLYQFLDENLDFHRFDMTFIGNSPVDFKRIQKIDPLSRDKLASELRKHQLFITASRNDPCSNSLIEAIHCGLPALVLNDGGHPFILEETGGAGLTFESEEDVLYKLDELADNLEYFQRKINPPTIQDIADHYYHFCTMAAKQKEISKPFNFFVYLRHQLQGRKLKFQKRIA